MNNLQRDIVILIQQISKWLFKQKRETEDNELRKVRGVEIWHLRARVKMSLVK